LKINFFKYQGAGNDFVIIDDRNGNFSAEKAIIQKMCDRHFGIGADGLMLLQKDQSADFRMVYYNADGKIGSMCGNGGRCIVRFAESLGLIGDKAEFMASDGLHTALVRKEKIRLSMCDVEKIEKHPNHWFLDTGSPHHIEFVGDTQGIDVKTEGAKIRYASPYFEKGSNVNFVQILNEDTIRIRTYERGVEDETLACGTGVTAAAIAAYESGRVSVDEINVKAVGGDLKVSFSKDENGMYREIWLSGPAEFEFKGEIEIK